MIITIAGLPGAGKTSVARELAKRLGFEFISAGDIRGQMAIGKGITIDELNALGRESDTLADERQKQIIADKDHFILEGWISWFFAPQSFKILVTVDPTEGARRIYEEKKTEALHRADERIYDSIEDAEKVLAERVEDHRRAFQELYGVENFADPKHFDFVLNTTNSPGPVENADKIMAAMKEKGLIK